MGKTFYIRNVPEKTKQYIRRYSAENHLTMADALADLMLLASEHLYLCNGKKEYKKAYEALKARQIDSLFGIAKGFKPFVRDKKTRTFDRISPGSKPL